MVSAIFFHFYRTKGYKMFKIRVVTTGSKSKAVQVVSYYNNKRKVIKHFGSCKTEDELTELTGIANE